MSGVSIRSNRSEPGDVEIVTTTFTHQAFTQDLLATTEGELGMIPDYYYRPFTVSFDLLMELAFFEVSAFGSVVFSIDWAGVDSAGNPVVTTTSYTSFYQVL